MGHDLHNNQEDPCADHTSTRIFAHVWFFAVLAISSCLAYNLAKIDRTMYDTKGEYIDNISLKKNRSASTAIASESVDSRQSPALRK